MKRTNVNKIDCGSLLPVEMSEFCVSYNVRS